MRLLVRGHTVVDRMISAAQLGDAALVRVALHAPLDGPLVLGSVLAGTFDFRASQIASSSSAPKCIQASSSSGAPSLSFCLKSHFTVADGRARLVVHAKRIAAMQKPCHGAQVRSGGSSILLPTSEGHKLLIWHAALATDACSALSMSLAGLHQPIAQRL